MCLNVQMTATCKLLFAFVKLSSSIFIY